MFFARPPGFINLLGAPPRTPEFIALVFRDGNEKRQLHPRNRRPAKPPKPIGSLCVALSCLRVKAFSVWSNRSRIITTSLALKRRLLPILPSSNNLVGNHRKLQYLRLPLFQRAVALLEGWPFCAFIGEVFTVIFGGLFGNNYFALLRYR